MSPQRGRPRDSRIDEAVIQAAVQELGESGVAGFSINRVAARAGVDKRGIYARWPARDTLIASALGSLAAGLVPPRTGTLAGDLAALAPAVAAVCTPPRLEILQRCVAEARAYPALYAEFRRDSVDRCAAAVEDAFHEARRRGEIAASASPALAAECFLGMLLARATLTDSHDSTGPAGQREVIGFCLAAVGARPG